MKKIFLVTIIIIFLGCQNNQPKQEINSSSVDTSKSIMSSEPIKLSQNFSSFWIEFRNSAVKMDTSTLIRFVNFPLDVLGREDNDPKFKISKDKFNLVFTEFLNTKTEMDYDDNRNFLKLTLKAENYSGYLPDDTTFQRMNDMIFEKKDKDWKLTYIYLDTKELKNKLNSKNKDDKDVIEISKEFGLEVDYVIEKLSQIFSVSGVSNGRKSS